MRQERSWNNTLETRGRFTDSLGGWEGVFSELYIVTLFFWNVSVYVSPWCRNSHPTTHLKRVLQVANFKSRFEKICLGYVFSHSSRQRQVKHWGTETQYSTAHCLKNRASFFWRTTNKAHLLFPLNYSTFTDVSTVKHCFTLSPKPVVAEKSSERQEWLRNHLCTPRSKSSAFVHTVL